MGNFQIGKFTKILIFHKNFLENHTWVLKNPVRGMLSGAASMDTEMNTF